MWTLFLMVLLEEQKVIKKNVSQRENQGGETVAGKADRQPLKFEDRYISV